MSTAVTAQLEDDAACRRDIPYLTSLGVNTIIVDNIRPALNGEHSACMELLQNAGIYTMVGLGTLGLTIQSRQAWDSDIMQRFASIIDDFGSYNNVLGFFVTGSPITVPFVRGAVRDLKKYVRKKGRAIPIGYLGKTRGKDLSNIINCGDPQNTIDFMALDLGSDCETRPKLISIVETVLADHSDYSAPTILYSPQCDSRKAVDASMFSPLTQSNVTKVMSGAVVFSYFNYLRSIEFPGSYFQITVASPSNPA
jgi:hypothetical protein